jgi:hypothetical protein
MIPSVGFYNHVNTKPKATEYSLQSIRKFYPEGAIALSCDNAFDFTEMAKKYNAVYHHNTDVTLGYPVQPFGYRKDKVIVWLDRMYHGVITLKTDYFVFMEDDVHVINPIIIDPSWEMAGHVLQYPGQVYAMTPPLLDMIEQFSGVKPKQNFYNCGGGSIFKTSTFIDNYTRVRQWFIDNLDYVQDNHYPTLGWMDAFLCVFYLLCGKELTQNPKLYNNWPIKIPFPVNQVPEGTYLVHNFKDYYNE